MSFDETPIRSVANYWNQRPCNIRHSPSPVGTRQYFDEVEKRKYLVEPHIRRFAQFERWAGCNVLEIGCGIGTDSINFARAGAHVTAVDLSSKSLELAEKRAAVYGLSKRIQFVNADAEQLSETWNPRQYDLIYSFGAIHHSPHPKKILNQIKKYYAGPGTILKIMVYHRYSYKVAQILSRFILKERRFPRPEEVAPLIARYSEAQTGCPVTFTFSKKEVALLLEDSFEITEARVEHIFPYDLGLYKNYEYKKTPLFRYLPNVLFEELQRVLGWHLCVTARFNSRSPARQD